MLLKVASVSKSFGRNLVLADVGFSVRRGEVLGLIGILVSPYLPIGIGCAIDILTMTVVLPLVFWCVKWPQIQSDPAVLWRRALPGKQ